MKRHDGDPPRIPESYKELFAVCEKRKLDVGLTGRRIHHGGEHFEVLLDQLLVRQPKRGPVLAAVAVSSGSASDIEIAASTLLERLQ